MECSMEHSVLRNELKKAFGESLSRHRRYSHEVIAEKGDIALRYLYDLEAGNKLPSLLTIMRLCYALDVSPDDLLLPVLKKYKKLRKSA